MTPTQCWPDTGEADILEMINGDGFAHGTYHWTAGYPARRCAYPAGHESFTAQLAIPDWDTTFHEYAIERGPTYIAYVYDGVVIVNQTGTAAGPPPANASAAAAAGNDAGAPVPSPAPPGKPLYWDVPFYVILNTAIGGPWPGNATDETAFPVEHVIDYVRVVARTG